MTERCLFSDGDLRTVLDGCRRHIAEKVDAISRDQLLATPVDDLVQHIVSQTYVEPLTIYEDRMTRDQSETKIDVTGRPGLFMRGGGPCLVSGIRVIVSLPFTGESRLWRLRPDTFSTVLPHGTIGNNALQMEFEHTLEECERIKGD